ncbi:MAG: DUF971 domain-containing protein [Chloroflexota bacterium]|jgi:DUF971 family protein|tara:strand:- start:49618 stop:49947 length:330 start_codon:yes stop_codon:yes gene_type:complete
MNEVMYKDVKAKSVVLTETTIDIEWSDGNASKYKARDMRLNCGCAECVEEWSQRRILDPASVPIDIRAEDYILVGNYAIQFLWSDAHYTGIYPFDVIRKLFPSEEKDAS